MLTRTPLPPIISKLPFAILGLAFTVAASAATLKKDQEEILGTWEATGTATDLVNGVWLPLTTFTGPVTNGNQVTITDTGATQPTKFYRIDISKP